MCPSSWVSLWVICEEPQELIEGERPRPQGSSPVNEYPANEKYSDKQAEQEIYDPYHKSGSTKKGKWVGFGSFFEKRSFARMSQTEDIEDTESGVFVRTVKEAGVEGLIVRGGGKAGIFVQEVKPESPASKHLSVKEGDQILSATLYFDNVSYEDALEILGHAQTCKMELCLKRKTPSASSTLERSTDMQPEFASEEASPAVRGRPKTQRRQEARISWPKFPSLTRGRKAYFKRSHSTSEAEEEKLELSPTTSDTESPVKSQKVVKDKTKMQKVKVSKVKTSLRSKSADQSERLVVEPTPEFVEFIEKQEALQKTSDSLGPQGAMLTETLVVDETVRKAAGRMRNECTFPSGSGTEAEPGRHKSELISLDKTLKTTDITDSLVDQKCHSAKHSPDGKKRKKKQRSELRVNIQGKEKEELSPDSLLMSPQPLPTHTSPKAIKIPDTETRTQDFSVVLESTVSPRVISHAEMREHQMAIDINSQRVNISQPAPKVDKKIEGEQLNLDGNLIKADTSFDISDISTSKRYQKTDSGKQWKERSILISDLKRYGIRSRSPTADISLARAHFGVPATKVDSSPLKPITSSSEHGLLEKMSDKTPKIPSTTSLLTEEALEKTSFRKDSGSSTIPDVGIKDPLLKLGDSELPVETKTNGLKGELDAVISPKFKLPKKDITDLDIHETMLQKTKQEHPIEKIEKKINLPKREDIEIPGMEATASKASAPVPGVKMTVDIQMQTINVDNIKEVSSKTDQPTVKLPKVDLPDLDTHPQITKTDVTAEKVNLNITPAISKSKTSHMTGMSEDASIIGPQSVTQTDLNEGKIKVFEQSDTSYSIAELSKRSLPTFKLPKTQLADADSHQPITMTQLEHSKLKAEMIGLKPETFLLKEKDGADLGMEPEIRIKLPNREDFEIPGSEGSVALANNNQLPGIKPSQTGDVTAAQTSAIETQKVHAVISSDTTKDTTSKLRCSTMKLPNVEFSEPDSHQQITKVDVDAEK
ncbi:neuroblast differentiation-associated protein AHNAK-like isoform X1, partial [Arapaima gigas]